ncbi:MAG TPA: 16S rRNA (cytidine(1402)-2'-O)-methyltransferase [Anaerolineales bacterium]|nr:16S rRNA (cytidine(1402)-2'-O)-methyltransferase [Anaerolineales bacterium]
MGTLYLVSTPIGHLEDITLRALRVLREAALIASEDTRQTRKLLSRYGVETRQVSYHEHSPPSRLAALLQALERGDVALVSDAGTPGLSDPGYDLVRAAYEGGHDVRPVPGASAALAALVASGLPSDSFSFLGYLPRRRSERRRRLESVSSDPQTLIFFEVPHRLRSALTDLETILGPERQAAVCRELTKVHEETRRGSLADLRRHFAAHEPRGEFTLVIAGARAGQRWGEAEVRAALRRRRQQGDSPSHAARVVAEASGWRRSEVYRLSLGEPGPSGRRSGGER